MNCACSWEGDPGRTTVKLCGGHQQIVDKSVAAEREACARIADAVAHDAEHLTQEEATAIMIAADIRART